MMRRNPPSRIQHPHGFTLVELLVVITIIGILIALLLPAVQAAREAARKTQCCNNLKQLSLAVHNHEQATGRFPTNGWHWLWVGDPDRGNDYRQPGGWLYNILPYMEQQALHDLAMGTPPGNHSKRRSATTRLMQTPVATFICPSRREVACYPLVTISGVGASGHHVFNYTNYLDKVARSDYAINGGDVLVAYPGHTGPADLNVADSPAEIAKLKSFAKDATGVGYVASMVTMAMISDGTSNTYLAGEKGIAYAYYTNGEASGDNEGCFIGDNADITRWTTNDGSGDFAPCLDVENTDRNWNFGSAHSSGFNMCFCDGSVRSMMYTIDLNVHRYLGNRKDGEAIDAANY